jgi:hypothetical protein
VTIVLELGDLIFLIPESCLDMKGEKKWVLSPENGD